MSEEYLYNHFAKPADVWKHLVLCEAMINEKPQTYVETNSACAFYYLDHTPEQEYGIYTFLKKATEYQDLYKSKYYELEKEFLKENIYLGSSGLAMSILKGISREFYFFDIVESSLSNVAEFSTQNKLIDKTKIINQDSVIGTLNLLPKLPENTLIHIDPYDIDKPSENGKSYLDVFLEASKRGIQCILWYGFNTLREKENLNNLLIDKLADEGIDNLLCVELIMDIIQKDSVLCNPGILGNGILTSNLSNKSQESILQYSLSLTNLYKGSYYKGVKGDLYRDMINLAPRQEIKHKRSNNHKLRF